MTLKFIPPKEDAQSFPRYASYGAGELKTHGTLAGARNSLSNRTAPYGWTSRPDVAWKQGFILENIEGEWYTLYHVKEGSKFKDLPWVKEFFQSYGGWTELTDRYRTNSYYSKKIESGEWKTKFKAVPMTRDEYVNFRLAVQKEILSR